MSPGRRLRAGALLALLLPALAAAGDENPPSSEENRDLELIPKAAQQPPTAPAETPAPLGGAGDRIYLENALTLTVRHDALEVPYPPPAPFDWQERVFLDARTHLDLGEQARLVYSGRLNLRFENDIEAPDHENLINDLREVYVSLEPAERSYVDVGRINLKSGVALGFNPTDYFKTRAVVEPLSADPSVLREDRLGTLMLRLQRILERGAVTLAYAPKVEEPSPIYTNLDLPSFNPMLARTNADNRALLKASANLSERFSPELLLYRDGSQTEAGLDLTESIGQRWVGYLEWSGGRTTSLVDQALQFGRITGSIPAGPTVLPDVATRAFREQLALGASYTSPSRITVSFEYDLDQTAFTQRTWRQWFAVGTSAPALPLVADELWLIRDYALEQQRPISRNSAFVRADWVDAFVPKLELVGLIDVDLRDGSELVQLSADYALSDHWSIGGVLIAFPGPRDSNFGSLPERGSVLITVARYF